MRPDKYQGPPKKFSRHGDLQPKVCAPLILSNASTCVDYSSLPQEGSRSSFWKIVQNSSSPVSRYFLSSWCDTFGKTSEFSVRTLQQLLLGPRLWPTPATCVLVRLQQCQPVRRDIRTINTLRKKQFIQTIMTEPQPEAGVTTLLAKQ